MTTTTNNVLCDDVGTIYVIEETAIDSTLKSFATTSAKIRYLVSIGWKDGDVARKLNIRHQHARNVRLQVLKKTS